MVRDYLTYADLMKIHELMIKHYGGEGSIRDPGALEACVFRPQSGYYKDIIQEAAALFESLVLNHPFMDGNKRVGVAAIDVFLAMNGHVLDIDSQEFYPWMLGLMDAGNFKYESIEPCLRQWVKSL